VLSESVSGRCDEGGSRIAKDLPVGGPKTCPDRGPSLLIYCREDTLRIILVFQKLVFRACDRW
jgi:hypothetical protein